MQYYRLQKRNFGVTSLSGLSERELRQALIRISQFVLRGDIKEIRGELQSNIVELVFYWNKKANEGLLGTQVAEVVSEEFPFITVDKALLNRILKGLTEKGSLQFTNKKYSLSSTRRNVLEKQVRENVRSWMEVNRQLLSKLSMISKAPLTREQKEAATSAFCNFLVILFMERADIVAGLLTSKATGAELKRIRMPLAILNSSTEVIEDLPLRNDLRKSIIKEFQRPSKEMVSFLFRVSKNLTCFQILNLDPNCQRVERAAMKEKVLFLDTNMLIALLCKRVLVHKMAKECVAMSKKLGIDLVYSELTLQEYRKVLENSDASYRRLRVKDSLLDTIDNEFIAAYALEKKAKPTQTWDGYYYRLRYPEELLKREFGIFLYKRTHGEVLENPHMAEISNAVNSCYKEIRSREKEDDIAKHDAYHLILMRELRARQQKALFGPKHWFLTLDQTLYCADQVINEKIGYTDKTPSNVLCDIWIEMISPFVSLSVRSERAVNLFTEILTSQFAVVPFRISTESLIEIQGDWTNYRWMNDEHLVSVLKDKFVSKSLHQLREARRTGESTTEYILKVEEGITAKLNSIAETRIKDLETRIRTIESSREDDSRNLLSLQHDKEELERKLSEVGSLLKDRTRMSEKEEKFRRQLRILSMILGSALIALNIWSGLNFVISGSLSLGLYTLPYMLGLAVIGGLLILIGVAYEQVYGYFAAKSGK